MRDGSEIGAALTVYHRGRCVVDLWGGQADVDWATPWERDTRIVVFSIALATTATAAPVPYDESANATVSVQLALTEARAGHLPVLVILGANWCEDCRALDAALKSGRSSELLAREFKVVKVDVGNFDRNLDLVAELGNPIAKGIPAAVVLSPSGQVLYATKGGELADARQMSESGVYDFFKRVVAGIASKR